MKHCIVRLTYVSHTILSLGKLASKEAYLEQRMDVYPKVLTVLNYHRVDHANRPGFDSYSPNVTAAPGHFKHQVDYLKRHYKTITCTYLSSWLNGESELPPNSAMITFDDGYHDNYSYAYPILKAKNVPATIFLATGYIDSGEPFYWDAAAYCFVHSQKSSTNLPHLGYVSWADRNDRKKVMKKWVGRVKLLPEEDKRQAVKDLAETLEVSVPEGAFSGLYLTWDQVREMSQNGIEIGSHTINHPILTRIPLSEVDEELKRSKQKIEHEIEKPVVCFAYPNGRSSDFSPSIIQKVHQAGYKLAFSLTGGASYYEEVRKHPLTIRRIFLSAADTFPRFLAKLALGQLIAQVERVR